jgi:hypothetical protein
MIVVQPIISVQKADCIKSLRGGDQSSNRSRCISVIVVISIKNYMSNSKTFNANSWISVSYKKVFYIYTLGGNGLNTSRNLFMGFTIVWCDDRNFHLEPLLVTGFDLKQ